MRRFVLRRRAITTAVVLATVLGGLGCARSRPSPAARRAVAEVSLSEGERRLALERPREAAQLFFRALAGYRDASDVEGEVASLLALGRVQRRFGRDGLALDFFAKAAELANDTGARLRAAAHYGETLAALGRNDAAADVLEGVLRQGAHVAGLARGSLWLQLARIERARGKLRRALAATEKAVAQGNLSEGRSFQVDILVELGELERAFELSQGVPLAWVQEELLDRDTRLLAYVLGERRNFVWDVTPAWLQIHPLADSSSLAELLREAHGELSRGPSGATLARSRLSRALLGAVAIGADERRVVVVSTGELASFPFGALYPGDARVPLVSRLQVVRARSLARLRLLRSRSGRRYQKWVAVAADPSYGLSGARREARAIAALAPPGMVTVVAGSGASAERVFGVELEGSRILHLATHGLPGRGLVLSDTVVGSAEIERLNLTAETVVLSACGTELTDLFLGRGARRVVASHWDVDDEATAELMVRFYAGLFAGASPAEALRQAQIALWRRPRFREPRYWAAFELHGDWAI